MHLQVWTDFPTAGSRDFDCKMQYNARCWNRCVDMTFGLLRFQLHFTCSANFFLSFEVRACCDSAVDFTGKKVVSVVVIFKIEVARDFYVTNQRISTSWGVCRLLGCSRTALSAALRLRPVACAWIASGHAESNFRCVPVSRSNSVSFHLTQTFPEKSLSPLIMPCSRAFFKVRNRAFPIPDVRLPCTRRIVHRSMDPEVLTAKGQVPHDEACRSLRTSTVFMVFDSHPRLQAAWQAASETHVALFRPLETKG